ncbi:MAG TPA: hypothetical protein VGW36_00030 [Pyrinomonadaceae bacterium]|nr:hypothetical protein [Pyrinomonadaceae bacterium]
MNISFFKFICAALVLSASISNFVLAQGSRRTPAASPATGLLSQLPASDAVALIKVRRVLDEAMPKLLAENPAKVAEVNSELAKFQTQTGLDPRAFEEIALGLQYSYPSEGVTKINTVALAKGTFNAGAMVAAGRVAANGKYREQKYQGKTIYVFTLDRQVRLFGLWDVKVADLAVTSLDTNTLAMGTLAGVQNVVDAQRTRKYANPELLALAARDPNAIFGFGGNISEALLQNLRISNDGIARELTAVRTVYGTLGMTASDLELMLAARTVDNYSAKNLSDTVEGLKQFGALFINRLSAAKGTLARTALNNLTITTTGNELQLRTAVGQSQVAPLMRGN